MIEELPALSTKLYDGSFTCVDLVKCIFHLNETEMAILRKMQKRNPLTVKEVAGLISRDRTTAYRALEKLVTSGIVYRERKGRETRGYTYYYHIISRTELYNKAEHQLDECYSRIKSLLENQSNID